MDRTSNFTPQNLERMGLILIAYMRETTSIDSAYDAIYLNKLIQKMNRNIFQGTDWPHELVYSLECGQYPSIILAFYTAKEFKGSTLIKNKIFDQCLNWLISNNQSLYGIGGSFGYSAETLMYIIFGLACSEPNLYDKLLCRLSQYILTPDSVIDVLPISVRFIHSRSSNGENSALVNATTLCKPVSAVREILQHYGNIDIMFNSFHGLWSDITELTDISRHIYCCDYSNFYRYSGALLVSYLMENTKFIVQLSHCSRLIDEEAAIWLAHLNGFASVRLQGAVKYREQLVISGYSHTVIPDHPLPELIPFVADLSSNYQELFSVAFHVDKNLYSPIIYPWISKFNLIFNANYNEYVIYTRYNGATLKNLIPKPTFLFLKGFTRARHYTMAMVYNLPALTNISQLLVLLVDDGPLLVGPTYLLANETVLDFEDRIKELGAITHQLFKLSIKTLRLRPNTPIVHEYISNCIARNHRYCVSPGKPIVEDIDSHDVVITTYPTTATFDALSHNKPCISFVRTKEEAEDIISFHS